MTLSESAGESRLLIGSARRSMERRQEAAGTMINSIELEFSRSKCIRMQTIIMLSRENKFMWRERRQTNFCKIICHYTKILNYREGN